MPNPTAAPDLDAPVVVKPREPGEPFGPGYAIPAPSMEPFCACGRVVPECDGSRAGCQRKQGRRS